MNKTALLVQAEIAKLHESLRLLQQKKYLRIADIHKWLSENINHACDLVTGERGRTLRFTGKLSCALVEEDNKLLGLADGYWDYSGKRKQAPDLLAISTFFDGITFTELKDEPVVGRLGTSITLDMTKWPTVTDMMLYTEALNVFIFPVSDVAKQLQDIANIEIILKHTYPHMTMTQLNIAHDIGLIHDQPSLYDWLVEMQSQQNAPPRVPPDNLVR